MSKTTPKDLAKKRNDEKLLISEMIALYCRRQHHSPKGKLCPECQQLHDYALARIEHCPFMETKTFLLCLQSSLLSAGDAGKDPHCHALGRAADAAGASRSLHQACDRDNEGKA